MNRKACFFGLVACLSPGLLESGCASTSNNTSREPGGNPANGGKVDSGGNANTGGGSGSSGSSGSATGGTPNTGGSAGSTSSGGGSATGGAPNTGGSAGSTADGGGTGGSTTRADAGGSVTSISCLAAQKKIVVAADGSGDFTTLKAAWDSLPAGNTVPTSIFIRNGVYRERILLQSKAFVTFRGEDRSGTRIEFEAGVDVVCAGGDDIYGCALVKVDGAHDIAFDNLTINNTWTGGGKAIAWRAANSTRIILKDVDLVGKAGDTHYTSGGGLFYYSGIYVSGTYHIIVPRMTTWISDSTFNCLIADKCLFNESDTEESQKLVIRNSTIEGVPGFRLGSYFRDAAWYFIDVKFSTNMANTPLYREQETDPLTWGIRQYFAGSSGATYDWLQDNIASSPAGTKEQVTLGWVFPDWDPGKTLICP